MSRSPVKCGILIGYVPKSLGVGSLLRFLCGLSGSIACMGADGPELAMRLVFCNSRCLLLFAFLRNGGLWRMRVFRDGELGVGSIFFCIITSLAYGGVMVLPRFGVVVEGCDVVTSILRSMGSHVSDV